MPLGEQTFKVFTDDVVFIELILFVEGDFVNDFLAGFSVFSGFSVAANFLATSDTLMDLTEPTERVVFGALIAFGLVVDFSEVVLRVPAYVRLWWRNFRTRFLSFSLAFV